MLRIRLIYLRPVAGLKLDDVAEGYCIPPIRRNQCRLRWMLFSFLFYHYTYISFSRLCQIRFDSRVVSCFSLFSSLIVGMSAVQDDTVDVRTACEPCNPRPVTAKLRLKG